MTVELHGAGLTPHDVLAVARRAEPVTLAPDARAAMERSRALVAAMEDGPDAVYGVSTGFGALASTKIPPDRRVELQHAIVRSHAAGMGPPVEDEVVRAMMLLRARTLAMGVSGVRPVVVDTILALLNAGVTPPVPEHGSLGASGDLAPLAHVGLWLLGEGDGAAAALAAAGVEPLRLEAKEGLALVNGTDGMLGMLVLACHDLAGLLRTADITAAMSIEALLGTDRPFADDLQQLRPHPGQIASARNLTRLLEGSAIVGSHRDSDHAVQDSYSMRCTPQVLGAARDTLLFAEQVAARELDSAVDNPVVLPDGRVESNGNFHGAPLGYACDFLAIAAADVGAMAERRVDRLLDVTRSGGLPAFLAEDPGVNSGMMIAQYTAAALVAESQGLAHPASVDTVPTSGMQEDHVSMGWGAARKLRRALENLAAILAVEAVCAARALDLRAPLTPAAGTGAARDRVRIAVPGAGPDRHLAPELEGARRLVASGQLVAAAEDAIGALA